MATIAARIAELEAELVVVKATQASRRASGTTSRSADGMSSSYASVTELNSERTRIEKALQRLYRGGRGMLTDMSYTQGGVI